jgi:hypothetical protein
MKWIPSRVPRCLPAVRHSAGPTPLSFLVPSTASPRRPHERRVVQPRLGSAHRFSQPLSGFLAHLGFAALFHAATVPGIPPFRAFPSQESRTPLGATLLPCRHPPTCWDASPGTCHRRFRRLPRSSARSPGSPDAYGFPFDAPEGTPPGPPGPRAAKPSRSARFTDFEALILLRVRSHRHRFP